MVSAAQPASLVAKLFLPAWKRWAVAASLFLLAGLIGLFLLLSRKEDPVLQEAVASSPPRTAIVATEKSDGNPLVVPAAEPEPVAAPLAARAEQASPPPPTIEPPPVLREPAKEKAKDLELAAFREGIRKRMESARRKIANQDFDAARRDLVAIHSLIEEGPRGMEREQDSLRRLEDSLERAVLAQQRAEQAREWESRLQAARDAFAEGDRSRAQALARDLLATPGLSEPTASRARDLLAQAKESPPITRRSARTLTIARVQIDPQILAPEGRAVATAHVIVNPPFDQPAKVNVRVRVMKDLAEIADPINQIVTVPAGGGTLRFNIPVKIPQRAPVGGCYLDIQVEDSTQQARGSGRIGFTIQ